MKHILQTDVACVIKVMALNARTHPVNHRTPMATLNVRINLQISLYSVPNFATGDENDVSVDITFCL